MTSWHWTISACGPFDLALVRLFLFDTGVGYVRDSWAVSR
jgi:hypothetical protein